jgi:hypothetical protein
MRMMFNVLLMGWYVLVVAGLDERDDGSAMVM